MNSPLHVKIVCPKCNGYRTISGISDGLYKAPATFPCDRCINSSGEVWADSLTQEEMNSKPKKFFARDDNP